jgi:hypothetical protein
MSARFGGGGAEKPALGTDIVLYDGYDIERLRFRNGNNESVSF